MQPRGSPVHRKTPRYKPVTSSIKSLYESWMCRIVPKRTPEFLHTGRQCCIADGNIGPYGTEEIFFADDFSRSSGEQAKQRQRLGSDPHLSVAAKKPLGLIETIPAESNHLAVPLDHMQRSNKIP